MSVWHLGFCSVGDLVDEYSNLITSQLETQREHFENEMQQLIEQMEGARSEEVQVAAADTDELKRQLEILTKEKKQAEKLAANSQVQMQKMQQELDFLGPLNKQLLTNQAELQKQLLEGKKDRQQQLEDLQDAHEQIKDLMFHMEASRKIEAEGSDLHGGRLHIQAASTSTPQRGSRNNRRTPRSL